MLQRPTEFLGERPVVGLRGTGHGGVKAKASFNTNGDLVEKVRKLLLNFLLSLVGVVLNENVRKEEAKRSWCNNFDQTEDPTTGSTEVTEGVKTTNNEPDELQNEDAFGAPFLVQASHGDTLLHLHRPPGGGEALHQLGDLGDGRGNCPVASRVFQHLAAEIERVPLFLAHKFGGRNGGRRRV